MSGTQLLLPASGPSETWSKYPEAQNRLFGTIRRAEAEGVVFITGDKHYAEVARRDDIRLSAAVSRRGRRGQAGCGLQDGVVSPVSFPPK